MYKITFLLALVIGSLSACTIVRYYEVKPMQESFNRTASETTKILEKVRTDLKQKRFIVHSLKKQGANMQEAPYHELSIQLAPLQNLANLTEKEAKNIRNLKIKFHEITRGKAKITSKSPDYNRLDQLQSQTKETWNKLEESVETYKKSSRTLETAVERAGVREMNVPQTRRQLRGFLRKLDANIGLLRSQGSKVQAASLGKQRTIYNAITNQLMLIERERNAVTKLMDRFSKLVKDQEKVWIGPGLLTYEILNLGEARAKRIQELGEKISQLAKNISNN